MLPEVVRGDELLPHVRVSSLSPSQDVADLANIVEVTPEPLKHALIAYKAGSISLSKDPPFIRSCVQNLAEHADYPSLLIMWSSFWNGGRWCEIQEVIISPDMPGTLVPAFAGYSLKEILGGDLPFGDKGAMLGSIERLVEASPVKYKGFEAMGDEAMNVEYRLPNPPPYKTIGRPDLAMHYYSLANNTGKLLAACERVLVRGGEHLPKVFEGLQIVYLTGSGDQKARAKVYLHNIAQGEYPGYDKVRIAAAEVINDMQPLKQGLLDAIGKGNVPLTSVYYTLYEKGLVTQEEVVGEMEKCLTSPSHDAYEGLNRSIEWADSLGVVIPRKTMLAAADSAGLKGNYFARVVQYLEKTEQLQEPERRVFAFLQK